MFAASSPPDVRHPRTGGTAVKPHPDDSRSLVSVPSVAGITFNGGPNATVPVTSLSGGALK